MALKNVPLSTRSRLAWALVGAVFGVLLALIRGQRFDAAQSLWLYVVVATICATAGFFLCGLRQDR